MLLNNKLYQGIARRVQLLPRGRYKASKIVGLLWKNDPNWDPWILKDGDVYRLFYLVAQKGSPLWWKGESRIYGAISTDMKNWKDLGVVLAPEPANPWESGRMLAGCTYKEDGVYYLFYSAAGKGEVEIFNEGIGLATSTDGLHWQRYSNSEFLKPDHNNRWYGQFKRDLFGYEYDHFQWRDPYIFKDPKTSKYYMFICAYLKEGGHGTFRGCVGLAVADNITGPYELLPPAATPVVDGTNESPYYEMERPQVIYKNGKYHLFFSCWTQWLHPKWIEKVGRKNLTDSSLYWYISDNITGPFKPVSDKPVCRGSERTGIYGTNFFPASDKPEEFIAYGWYYRLMTLGISPLVKVRWDNNSIKIG